MGAAVWRGDADPSNMCVEILKTPIPKENEVLVKVKACGVCHTDLHCIKGEVPFPSPAVFGHEISGEVVSCGEGVDIAAGTKVVSPFIMPCGSCHFCEIGEEDTCETFFNMNRLHGHLYDGDSRLYKSDGEKIAMYSMGGLAEYAVVPKTAVFVLPPMLADHWYAESSILGCAFFTAIGAIRNAAHLQANHSVCVIGCGGVGGAVIQLAKHLGASPIIAIDIGERALNLAKTMGADYTINASQENTVDQVSKITDGRKVDVAFEVIGLKQTFEQAFHCVRDGGKACYIGISDVAVKAEVPITHIVRRRITLAGSYGARASSDMPNLIQMAADGGVDFKNAVTTRFSLDNAADAYSKLANGEIAGRAIVEID